MIDLVIIGASAAGCTAAIYAARRKIDFKIISEDTGGEIAMTGEIKNWPGSQTIQGFELAKNLGDHVKSYGIEIETGWKIEKISKEKKSFAILVKKTTGEEKTIQTKAVIISTGARPRKLNIPGEKELYRKGVTYCTICDGPLFKNKTVAVVGSGNSAISAALMLSSGIASKVYLFSKHKNSPRTKGGFPTGENILIEKLKSQQNVEIIYESSVKEIVGEKMVSALKYVSGKEGGSIEVGGVMVHIGMKPNSEFLNFVKKDKSGQIYINTKGETSRPGIFAAGDVTNVPHKQIILAAGQGCAAALSAIDYINKWK